MDIKSAQYFNNLEGVKSGIKVTMDSSGMLVPLDSDNQHYVEIMRQVDAGELTIEEAD